MDDLEICKRIAEIEGIYDALNAGIENQQFNHDIFSRDMKTGVTNPYVIEPFDRIYSPLVDDALCFQLMVKYRIKFYTKQDEYIAVIVNEFNGTSDGSCMDSSPNKAICLAIIEAHKES